MIVMKNRILNICAILILFLFVVSFPNIVYSGNNTTATNEADYSWVSDAFQATKSFFSDSEVTDELGMLEPWMIIFSDIVKAVNRVFIVALAGLSIISLAVVGIRYIMSAYQPDQKNKAKEDLHTVFKGMCYGFGAFTIWKIVMLVVRLIIESF